MNHETRSSFILPLVLQNVRMLARSIENLLARQSLRGRAAVQQSFRPAARVQRGL